MSEEFRIVIVDGSPPPRQSAPASPRPRFLEESDLRDPPDVATRRAVDRAIKAGTPDDEVKRLQDEINRYANEHTANRGTVYNREYLRATQAGKAEDEARQLAKDAVAAREKALQEAAPPLSKAAAAARERVREEREEYEAKKFQKEVEEEYYKLFNATDVRFRAREMLQREQERLDDLKKRQAIEEEFYRLQGGEVNYRAREMLQREQERVESRKKQKDIEDEFYKLVGGEASYRASEMARREQERLEEKRKQREAEDFFYQAHPGGRAGYDADRLEERERGRLEQMRRDNAAQNEYERRGGMQEEVETEVAVDRDRRNRERRKDLARREADPEYGGRAVRRDAWSVAGSLSQLGLGGASRMLGGLSGLLPAGAQAGLASGLAGAAAGPVGLAVMVAQEIKGKMLEGMAAMGQAGGRAAALDAGVLLDGATGALKALGPLAPMGDVVAEAVKGLKLFADGLSQTADKLKSYDASLATASAQADVRQIQGDIRRAQQLGPDLARFVEARSKLADAGQDLLAKLIKPLIPIVTKAIEVVTFYVEAISRGVDVIYSAIVDNLNVMIKAINEVLERLGAGANYLKQIEKNTKPDKKEEDFLDQLLALDPANPGLFAGGQQQGIPGVRGGGGPLFPGLGGGPAFGV